MSYCDFVNGLPEDTTDPNKFYHDCEYGFELFSDNELFERFVLEINQAGLSWITILKKRENFKKAYDNFEIEKVAQYNEQKIEKLLQDSGIIRNKLKIKVAIHNANKIVEIQTEFGSFKQWLDKQGKLELEEWLKLFKKHFKFVGKEIVNEFLMSTGYLPGAHDENCRIFKKTKYFVK